MEKHFRNLLIKSKITFNNLIIHCKNVEGLRKTKQNFLLKIVILL